MRRDAVGPVTGALSKGRWRGAGLRLRGRGAEGAVSNAVAQSGYWRLEQKTWSGGLWAVEDGQRLEGRGVPLPTSSI